MRNKALIIVILFLVSILSTGINGTPIVESNPNEFEPLIDEHESYSAQARADADGDGVNDGDDLCSGTTAGGAVDADGCILYRVVTWGASTHGGDSSSVGSDLKSGMKIFSASSAFATWNSDGSVITWGHASDGGDSSSVSSDLSSDVTDIVSTETAFAAKKSDGSVVTWGDSNKGGDSSSVSSDLSSDVSNIYSTSQAFAALKFDNSVVTWGYASDGGEQDVFERENCAVCCLRMGRVHRRDQFAFRERREEYSGDKVEHGLLEIYSRNDTAR